MRPQEQMNSLTQEIVRSYEVRAAATASRPVEVGAQLREARSYLDELNRSHRAMSRQLRGDLAKGRSDLASNVKHQLGELDSALQAKARHQREDLARGRADLSSSIASQLNSLHSIHQTMGGKQREDLAKGHAELTQAERERKSEEKAWVNEVATAHAEAREEWRDLTVGMGQRRNGPVAVTKPPESTATAVLTTDIESVEEELISGSEVGYMTPEFANLSDRVFSYLASHPDGTRLAELEQKFELNRFEAARIVRHLIEEGKAEKRDLLYFAI